MLMSILWFLIVGLIIGALARFVMPGHQNISMIVTIILGALGAVIGGWLVSTLFGYNNANGGIPWIGIIASVICAAGLIAAYQAIVGRRAIR